VHAVELLTTANTSTLVLLALRLSGLVLIAPVFSSRTVPVMLKSAILVVLTWLLFPTAVSASTEPTTLTFATAFSEALVGFAIGLAAAVFVGGAEAMGDLLAVQIGLSGASALDPLTNHSVPVLGQFASLFAVAILLAVNAHVLMIEAVAVTLQHIPVGSALDLTRGLSSMVSLGSVIFMTGLRFAAPVLAAVLLGNAALAVLARAAPSLNVISVAFPIQILLGLTVLVATIPVVGAFFAGWGGIYEGVLAELFRAFHGGR
jgi:flagellar biosynthesis protein FliR